MNSLQSPALSFHDSTPPPPPPTPKYPSHPIAGGSAAQQVREAFGEKWASCVILCAWGDRLGVPWGNRRAGEGGGGGGGAGCVLSCVLTPLGPEDLNAIGCVVFGGGRGFFWPGCHSSEGQIPKLGFTVSAPPLALWGLNDVPGSVPDMSPSLCFGQGPPFPRAPPSRWCPV